MNTQGQEVTAVTNALSGERSFRTIQYAITGDPELDLMAGMWAVIRDTQLDYDAVGRCLYYLLSRCQPIAKAGWPNVTKSFVEQQKKWEADNHWLTQHGLGSVISDQANSSDPASNAYGTTQIKPSGAPQSLLDQLEKFAK